MGRISRHMKESLVRQGLMAEDDGISGLSDAELERASAQALAELEREELLIEEPGISGPSADQDLMEANNPDVRALGEPPMIGTAPATSDIFGSMAQNVGQASSPLLYSQISNFPTAVQFRVWRWENGIPVAIGAIDCTATEDDFIEQFFHAMPKPGDRRFQFRLRPIDQRARELGKEITLNISEHHSTLQRLRERALLDKEESMRGYRGGSDPVFINSGNDQAAAVAAEEMGRMFERALSTSEEQTTVLRETLEQERERLRMEEKSRVEERIKQAENASGVVEKLTERLMDTDRQRSREALEAQRSSTDLMVQTLTTVFDRQSAAGREAAERQAAAQREMAERQRMLDEHRLNHDREFFARQQQELELRRQYEKEEAERKRQEERDRLAAEVERKEKEIEARLERDRMELQYRREQEQAERERYRLEMEEKRRQEQSEFERRMLVAREEAERQRLREQEDRDRRAREDSARWEREKIEMHERIERERLAYERRRDEERQELERKRQEERLEAERRDRAAREEAETREARRKEELALQMKAMEMTAQRDREHSERMLQMAAQEREAQREAALAREKAEREAREFLEAERQRKHELQLRDMELQRERDREHQERMLQLSRAQTSGLGGLTEMLGMKTPELLERIFVGPGGGEEEGEGGGGSIWEKIPTMIGSLADAAKIAMQRSAPRPAPVPVLPNYPNFQPSAPPPRERVVVQPAQTQAQAPEPDTHVQGEDISGPELKAEKAEPKTLTLYEQLVRDVDSKKVDLTAMAKAAKLETADIRKARKAIRELAKKLDGVSDEKGKELIMSAALATPVALQYVLAVSVYGALAEVKASEELAKRISSVLKAENIEAPLMPADVKIEEEA